MMRSSTYAAARGYRGWSSTIAVLACSAIALTACGSSKSSAGGVKGGSEVAAQPVSTPQVNPFTPAVGNDMSGVRPPSAAASSAGGPSSYNADLPGLYGGTRNKRQCNATKLVTFLEENPGKASAWAQTLGIQTSQIRSYVSGLTDVLLRTDTRVTNHSYANGQATPLQSVLEAGTAVYVDKYGRPVVKCYCGNPLTPPELLSSPTYTGPLWSGFSTTNITIIQQSIKVINIYTLYDPTTGKTFGRSPNGPDGPYSGGAPPPLTGGGTTSNPAPPTQRENPSVSLSPNPVTQGGTVTLSASGFAPGASLAITVHRPDGVTEAPRGTNAGSDGTATYAFPATGGRTLLGTFNVTVSNPSTGAQASASVEVVSSGGGTSSTPSGPGTTSTPSGPGGQTTPGTTQGATPGATPGVSSGTPTNPVK